VNAGFKAFLSASERDRLDTFLAASRRLGANAQYIEKDFWVCWTLDVLYHGLPLGGPRLLFKGGTSLSKAHGLINRFSEDIDITAFREDLNQAASVEDLEALTGKKRKAKLDAIRDACQVWVAGPLREGVGARLAEFASKGSKVELDDTDPDGQTLLVFYPGITPADSDYIRSAVRIECGAKSALDPHGETTIRPYVAEDTIELNISVKGVTTIEPVRSFWDKAVIAHGLRRWYEIRGELRQEGQRISRHYYDLHCLYNSSIGPIALANRNLAADCVRHARLFFNRPDFDLASAQPGSFAIEPSPGMLDRLRIDYAKTTPMIFGTAPTFEEIMASIKKLNASANNT
jgi:Nucleotidyl transferase AbiEii toxin, Type IV TA system